MEILIRKATVQDVEKISKIWEIICAEKVFTSVSHPFTPEQERNYILSLSDREGIFIAEADHKLVGFQTLDKWAKFSHYFDHVGVIGTFIVPEWRRKQIGSKLAYHTFNFARYHNYEKIIIYVRSGNSGAIDFYKTLGFLQKGVLSFQLKINNEYEDEIFMELFL
ncbi:MAG: GNAT family N-acetyltransferase [Promethearchaeota archaeon]